MAFSEVIAVAAKTLGNDIVEFELWHRWPVYSKFHVILGIQGL
jgi:hypothetical protein